MVWTMACKGLMWAFARLVVWGGAAVVISGLGATAQTAPAPSATAIPIVDDDEGVPVIEIYLNGRGPYRATFDTGAWGLEIDSDLAKEFGIKTSSQAAYAGLAGKAQGLERGGPISLAFGPVSTSGLEALVSPVEQGTERTRKKIRANVGPQFGRRLRGDDRPARAQFAADAFLRSLCRAPRARCVCLWKRRAGTNSYRRRSMARRVGTASIPARVMVCGSRRILSRITACGRVFNGPRMKGT